MGFSPILLTWGPSSMWLGLSIFELTWGLTDETAIGLFLCFKNFLT